MRAIPPYSTDFIYKGDFPRDELMELGYALGLSNINVVTTAAIKPERLLYHACLNGIQTYMKLHSADEVTRAREIADLADTMYEKLLPEFQQNLGASMAGLAARQADATNFCNQLEAIEGPRAWNRMRYQNTWNTNDYPPRWQKKAIETYGQIRARVESGEYTLPEGKTPGDFTAYWSLRNLEYKQYRDIARSLVESFISKQYPAEQLLTMHPAAERTMTMILGGMASGKSSMTEHFLESLPERERNDTVLHNADYLKYALYRRAVNDRVFPDDYKYTGNEVQSESSNALYEGTRKRAYLARQFFYGPDVVLNSIALNATETQEGIASGGKVVVHHLHISPEDAIAEADARCEKLGGRRPPDADIRWSAQVSAASLLLMTKPEYKGTDVLVHLYHRDAGKAPRHYATIDAAHSQLYIYDRKAFAALSKTAALPPDHSAEAMLQRFEEARYAIHYERSHSAGISHARHSSEILYAQR